jgi:hypothetical protein
MLGVEYIINIVLEIRQLLWSHFKQCVNQMQSTNLLYEAS